MAHLVQNKEAAAINCTRVMAVDSFLTESAAALRG